MIVDKLKELRTQKRSIEEIYKYTTDIILEEEDEEDEDEEEEKQRRRLPEKTSKPKIIQKDLSPYLNQ
jgi:hypothetical protein